MTLASYIRPFDGRQVIFVLDENTKDTVEKVTSSLEDYADTIMELLGTYSINKLNLHGSARYCQKIKSDIQTKELAKYSKNKLTINLIQG